MRQRGYFVTHSYALASRVFSSMAVFEILQENMFGIFGMIPMVIQGKQTGACLSYKRSCRP